MIDDDGDKGGDFDAIKDYTNADDEESDKEASWKNIWECIFANFNIHSHEHWLHFEWTLADDDDDDDVLHCSGNYYDNDDESAVVQEWSEAPNLQVLFVFWLPCTITMPTLTAMHNAMMQYKVDDANDDDENDIVLEWSEICKSCLSSDCRAR